jgi:hypothetical protein
LPPYSHPRFLKKAGELLPYAFEKSDAKEKWGGENVFSAMMGGRSLRYTGEKVYGTSAMEMGMSSGGQAYERVSGEVEGNWRQLVRSGEVFGDVGGVALWKGLHSVLRLQQAMY